MKRKVRYFFVLLKGKKFLLNKIRNRIFMDMFLKEIIEKQMLLYDTRPINDYETKFNNTQMEYFIELTKKYQNEK